jgi:hypothetical protein
MERIFMCLLVAFSFLSSTAQPPSSPPSPRLPSHAVGDIPFDPALDDSAFHLCDSSRVFQYYNTEAYFLDNKDSLRLYFLNWFKPGDVKDPSGYVTVKFIINCSGMTGRFRLLEMDSTYQPVHFDDLITGQLLSLVKGWKNWKPPHYKGKFYDSYQYITFRIVNGKIISISP